MRESRSARYGRFLAYFCYGFLCSLPEREREDYKAYFLKEVKRYSDKPRKKGQKRNSGCVNELEDLEFDILRPEHVARLIKEGLHLMYQKQTSKRVLESFLKEFQNGR